jgi:hypothetical protein
MELQNQEAGAVLSRSVGLARFDLALKRARASRDKAKQLYLLHLEEHGC